MSHTNFSAILLRMLSLTQYMMNPYQLSLGQEDRTAIPMESKVQSTWMWCMRSVARTRMT
jgi:hypothetical protein